jgi:hypothetical protein
MPIFTSIGLALGATIAASAGAGLGAFAVGVAAVSITAGLVAASVYSSQAQATATKKSIDAMNANQNASDQSIISGLAGVSDAQREATAAAEAGRVTGQEAEDTVAQRLSRVGRYFTSSLGDTSALSTASQKVFS